VKGLKNITKLRVQFSKLIALKYNPNFEYISPLWNCGMANEENDHLSTISYTALLLVNRGGVCLTQSLKFRV